MKTRSLLLATLLLAVTPFASAATYTVNNATDFNNLPTLNAGDVVIMNSGTYGSLNKTLVSSIADDATAQSNPILIYAATPGGVDVTAPSRITLQGRGITLAGLDFISGSGMLDNGSTAPAWIIKMDVNSRYMKISNVRFLNCVAGDDYGHWIYAEGFNHTIEYCSFTGKSNRNATVAFKRNTAEAGITTKRNHVLRFCYFGPRECSTTENGFETIRIGDSDSQAHDMNVTIERNVFYRAIWRNDGQKPNDMEIISNKSKGNKFLNNTFLESYGQLTLRHGDAAIVDGNFIFGGGYYSGSSILLNAANANQTGIRIIGQDHIVRNNYLVNLIGTNLRAALCLMGGESTHTDGNGTGGYNGYEAAHNAQIYNNTFIDCREINLGYRSAGTVNPTGVQFYNNAWQGSGTSNGIVRSNSITLGGSGGNYIYHPSGSYGWTGLANSTYSSSASPQITESFDNYKRPTSTSPLLNAANTTLVAATDIRGLARPSSGKDIGSYEREVSGSGLKPLLRNEVGPGFDGGPAGTYPVGGTVATPSFSPGAGTYTSAQSVTISTATSGATIRYTTNGTNPTSTSGTVYSGPVSVSSSLTLKAIAYKSGMTDSAVATASYTINTGGDPEIIPVSSPDSSPWDTAGSNGPSCLWDGVTADGGNGSRWAANASPDTLATAPRYVVLDLGASYNITKFVVHPYQSRAYHHEIYVSATNGNWGTAVVNVAPSTGAASYTHNVSATGRYVRLVIDGISGTTTTWASINELDIFGTAASGGGGSGAFIMSSNQVVMEAENANSRTSGGGKDWTNITLSGASGATSNNAIQSLANTGITASAPGTGTPRADYQIVVPSGAASTFYVHLRAHGPSGSDDSVYLSVNGSTSTYQTFNTTAALDWKRATNTITLSPGTQTLTVWMREDGTVIDKIVINTSTTLPTGTGPMESARQ